MSTKTKLINNNQSLNGTNNKLNIRGKEKWIVKMR